MATPPTNTNTTPGTGISQSSTKSDTSPASGREAEIRPINAENLLGYVYLCCQKAYEQKSMTSANDSKHIFDRIVGVYEALASRPGGSSGILDGAELSKILTANHIDLDLWKAVFKKVSEDKNASATLSDANRKGIALGLGLKEDASSTFIKAEESFRKDGFASKERERIYASMVTESSRQWKDPKGRILLHEIKTKPIYDIPADGFAEYKFSPSWFVKAAGMKIFSSLVTKPLDWLTGNESPSAAKASVMTWYEPVASSVRSPTIQKLFKDMRADRVDVESEAVPDNKGFLLKIRFFVSEAQKAKLQGEVHRMERLS